MPSSSSWRPSLFDGRQPPGYPTGNSRREAGEPRPSRVRAKGVLRRRITLGRAARRGHPTTRWSSPPLRFAPWRPAPLPVRRPWRPLEGEGRRGRSTLKGPGVFDLPGLPGVWLRRDTSLGWPGGSPSGVLRKSRGRWAAEGSTRGKAHLAGRGLNSRPMGSLVAESIDSPCGQPGWMTLSRCGPRPEERSATFLLQIRACTPTCLATPASPLARGYSPRTIRCKVQR